MKNKITHNLSLKILSVLGAVVLWFIVVNIDDPIIPVKISDIPIETINADILTNEGKVYDIVDNIGTVAVDIRGRRSIVSSLQKSNFKAFIDLKNLDADGKVPVEVTVNKFSEDLDKMEPSLHELTLNIENMQREQFVISTATVGDIEEGYILGDVTTDQNLVRLSGPESAMSKVEKVVASVSVVGVRNDISTIVELKLYDADDNLVDDRNIEKNINEVSVKVEILQLKTVPLIYSIVGTPLSGYGMTGEINSNPHSVVIAGKSAAVDRISQIDIQDPALNITGYSSDMTTVIDIKPYLPSGVVFGNNDFDGKATVTVNIDREVIDVIEIPKENISIANIPEEFTGILSGLNTAVAIQVSCMPEVLAGMDVSTIAGVVDIQMFMEQQAIETLEPGTYTAQITFALPNGVTQLNTQFATLVIQNKAASEEPAEETDNAAAEEVDQEAE